MQFLVEDSTNANERAIIVEGWTKDNPPVPLDISAVTLRVSIDGGTPANADGTTTRIDSSHVHRFVFNNSTQFQAFASGSVGVLIVPDSATGSGRMGFTAPFLVAAGNPGAPSLTAAAVSDQIAADQDTLAAIADAVNDDAKTRFLNGFVRNDAADTMTVDGTTYTTTQVDGHIASITA